MCLLSSCVEPCRRESSNAMEHATKVEVSSVGCCANHFALPLHWPLRAPIRRIRRDCGHDWPSLGCDCARMKWRSCFLRRCSSCFLMKCCNSFLMKCCNCFRMMSSHWHPTTCCNFCARLISEVLDLSECNALMNRVSWARSSVEHRSNY